ncbi:uncharacterized protein EDB91DRAFT_1145307, partial [Suillus paluster]|uniref:uncharacterized protein n=1 Tax=Suillus paluster TaxID=48578 RepID=UPI001B87E5BE
LYMVGKSKKPKVSLPEIPWSENNHSRVWKLITELGQKANYKVLFGKKDQHENTSDGPRLILESL